MKMNIRKKSVLANIVSLLSLFFFVGCLEEIGLEIKYEPNEPIVYEVIHFTIEGDFLAPIGRTEAEIYFEQLDGVETKVYENNSFPLDEGITFIPEEKGNYRISVFIADKMVNYGEKTLYFKVFSEEENSEPVMSITSHSDDQVIEPGDQTIKGLATDKEDGDISDQIEWIIDGKLEEIGSSIVFDFNQLRNYEIVAKVTDSNNAVGSVKIILIVKELIPKLELTHVSEYGDSQGYIEGCVTGISNPSDWIVVVYIEVHEVYWVKPYLAQSFVTLDEDGCFRTDITTGGQDRCATKVVVKLAPVGTVPELCNPCYELPDIEMTVDTVIVDRGPEEIIINFAGIDWKVKHGLCPMGPGDNYFYAGNVELVNGELHLKISYIDGEWRCAEVIAQESTGYGTYITVINCRLDQYDKNTVAAPFFTWDTSAPNEAYREIDVEISNWGIINNPTNAQFVVQPCSQCPGCGDNCTRFVIDQRNKADNFVTFFMVWQEGGIEFRAYYGNHIEGIPPQTDLIHSWIKTDGIPVPGNENSRINIWNFLGRPPSSEQELVITDYKWDSSIMAFSQCGDGIVDSSEDCDPPSDCCMLNCIYALNGTSCTDEEYCNGQEVCDGFGACVTGTEVDCDDGINCTNDACDEVNDMCINETNDDSCPDNGLFCDGDEFCDLVYDCSSSGDPCLEDKICKEESDICSSLEEECGIVITETVSGYVYGTAYCYDPNLYAIAIYIKVRGGWWTKPYWAWPTTEIFADYTWKCDIITGGVDSEATMVAAFLIKISYEPPLRGGQSELPQDLFNNDNVVGAFIYEIPGVI